MLRALLAAPLLFLSIPGCHRVSHNALKTRLEMGDRQIAPQLIRGFHEVEGQGWRWTEKNFDVMFPGPAKSGSRTLTVHLFVPDDHLKKLGQLTLSAVVDGHVLQAETFRQPGEHTYLRVMQERTTQSNLVPVAFHLDRAMPPVARGESRELGVVVNDLELRAN